MQHHLQNTSHSSISCCLLSSFAAGGASMASAATHLKQLLDEKSSTITRPRPQRSHSFNGRTTTVPSDHRQLRRPKTQPDVLAGTACRKRDSIMSEPKRKVAPAKVLVNVTVQRSLGPVQVMASSEWTVEELVTAVVRVYVKEGRRPLLERKEAQEFGLHYSQFSLECLDSKEKLMELGSRNFFLCPMSISAASSLAQSSSSTSPESTCCSREVSKGSKPGDLLHWLMVFLM